MTPEAIAALLQPYVGLPDEPADVQAARHVEWPRINAQLAIYLDLILKWNARVNLTAIREPEEIVRRHFGEGLFVASHLGPCTTLLDYGSGAGFPGIPIQLVRPDIRVTLAESRTKKAAFLREVIRTLGLPTEVWANRVESMPMCRQFETVALRAVDNMDAAVREATQRATRHILILGTTHSYSGLLENFNTSKPVALPGSSERILLIATRS